MKPNDKERAILVRILKGKNSSKLTGFLLLQPQLNLNFLCEFLENLSPLHYCVLSEELILAQILMEHPSTDPNYRDEDGNTPLHYAAAVGNPEIVKFLLERGSDSTAKNGIGKTPDDYSSSPQICRLLQQKSTKKNLSSRSRNEEIIDLKQKIAFLQSELYLSMESFRKEMEILRKDLSCKKFDAAEKHSETAESTVPQNLAPAPPIDPKGAQGNGYSLLEKTAGGSSSEFFKTMDLRSATVDNLIDRISSPLFQYDNFFIQTFLVGYRFFTSKMEILEKLRKSIAFNQAPLVALKIGNFLKNWVELFPSDIQGDQQVLLMMDALCREISHQMPQLAARITTSIKALNFLEADPFKELVESNTQSSSLLQWSNNEFMAFNPVDFAEQITLIEQKLFENIPIVELINHMCQPAGTGIQTKHLRAMADWSNRMVQLFVSLVLQCQTAPQRAATMELLIEIADALYSLKNFNGLKEVIAALQASAVDRLQKTRALIQAKLLKKLQKLSMAVDSGLNFKELRKTIHSSSPPLIPFPGLYQSDLLFLDNSCKTHLEDGAINFYKFYKMTMQLVEFRSFQQSIHKLNENPSILMFLINAEVMAEDEAYLRSLRIEPRNK